MNDYQIEVIKRFAADEATMSVVFSAIQGMFLKANPQKDVQYLAAKSLALEFLEDARKDILRYRASQPAEKVTKQIGL